MALYAIGLVILYTLVADTFSLALGYVFTLALPFLVAVHVFGRLPAQARLTGTRAAFVRARIAGRAGARRLHARGLQLRR